MHNADVNKMQSEIDFVPPRGKQGQTHALTCTENLVKIRHMVFDICELTDRQTDRHAESQYFTPLLLAK